MSEVKNISIIDVSKENDYDLLELMAWKEEDPEISNKAWHEFYKRHAKFIYNVANNKLKTSVEIESISDITTDLFEKVYNSGASSFKKSSEIDVNKVRGHVRSWLCSILRYMIIDLLRGKKYVEITIPYEKLCEIPVIEKESPSENVIKLKNIMEECLSDREKHVLSVHFEFFDNQNPDKNIPSDRLDEVCNEWGLTRANFRQIKSRAIKKLKEKYDGGV